MVTEDEEGPAPTTLAEWYEQLVEVAADGNAPPFEHEVERIVDLSVEECPCKGACHNGHTPVCSDACRSVAVVHRLRT